MSNPRPAQMNTTYDINTQRSICEVNSNDGKHKFACQFDPRSDISIDTMADERTAFLNKHNLIIVWSD